MAGSLVVSRMSERGLKLRLMTNLIQMSNYGSSAMKTSEVRTKALECRMIVSELELRGTQMTIWPESGKRE